MQPLTSSLGSTGLTEGLAITVTPARLSVSPAQRALATITVGNRSDDDQSYRLSIGGELAEWTVIQPAECTIPPGDQVHAKLILDVPVFAHAATYKVSVHAVRQGRAKAEELVQLEVEVCEDRLLSYLPSIFHDDPLLRGYLRIFESMYVPLERQIELLYTLFNPRLTPSDMLPWLGTWFDLVLDENWPEDRRRLLLQRAADLYERRGTAGALRDYLEIYTGVVPEISEDGLDNRPFHFTVTFVLERPHEVDADRIRRIIEEEKPAHTTYTLRLEQL